MTRRASRTIGWAWLFGLCLTMAGCARSEETPPAGGGQPAQSPPASQPAAATGQLTIDFRTEPDPPKPGDNTFEADVKQSDGTPVTDATVTVVFSMPAMPAMNMPAMKSTATLAHESSGRYRGAGQLAMNGTWNVTVTVARGGEELGSKQFSLVAK